MMNKDFIKNLPTWIKILIGICAILAVIVIGTYAYINSKLNLINRPKAFVVIPPEEEYFEIDESTNVSGIENEEAIITNEEVNYKDIIWPADGSLLKDKKIINILLIGQDRRVGQPRARADCMMIATINKRNDTIKITSLLRDMYVQIPGYSDNRINAAYVFGGMDLLDATIDKNFQVHIDGNIEVDFTGFQEVINRIGGIDIKLNAEEAAHLTGMGFKGLSEGMVYMDGSLALAYSRIRCIGNSDYERTERQRHVITAVFDKIKGLGISEILDLINVIFPLVTTDLSNGQIISMATSVALMGVDDVGTYSLPMKGTYTASEVRGMAVLVPDLSANRIALEDIIYGE
ncbi:MAG: LytR family transcriptional regulator [Clostridiales bacterium]|jgi:LCP family protein required for cell wall assembly|nr:LytR family transcriptional regulator [Clostridiales bacterium]